MARKNKAAVLQSRCLIESNGRICYKQKIRLPFLPRDGQPGKFFACAFMEGPHKHLAGGLRVFFLFLFGLFKMKSGCGSPPLQKFR